MTSSIGRQLHVAGFLRFWLARSGFHVAKLDKIYPAPGPVFGDLQKLNEPRESRTSGEQRGDVGERHLKERGHHDLPGRQRVSSSDPHVRPLPQPDATGDLSTPDALSQDFDELHVLRFAAQCPALLRHLAPILAALTCANQCRQAFPGSPGKASQKERAQQIQNTGSCVRWENDQSCDDEARRNHCKEEKENTFEHGGPRGASRIAHKVQPAALLGAEPGGQRAGQQDGNGHATSSRFVTLAMNCLIHGAGRSRGWPAACLTDVV